MIIIIAGSIVSDKALSEFALENSLGGFEFLYQVQLAVELK